MTRPPIPSGPRATSTSVQSGDIVLGVFAPELVGIIAITRDARTKRRHKADLHGMYVVPDHRGKGLGKLLLVQALQLARGMDGLEEIQLIVAAHNHEARGLYERFGFVLVWTELNALKVGAHYVDAHHMILAFEGRRHHGSDDVAGRASKGPSETAHG